LFEAHSISKTSAYNVPASHSTGHYSVIPKTDSSPAQLVSVCRPSLQHRSPASVLLKTCFGSVSKVEVGDGTDYLLGLD
jgi:hypothetical protein